MLVWTEAKASLEAADYYSVTLHFNHDGAVWTDFAWTRQTGWMANEHNYLLSTAIDGVFRWSVTLMRQTGRGANGIPEGVALSKTSEERDLYVAHSE